jgi:D-psicose/D-tagatose/L-ribulose 3-epimerase
MNEVGIYYGYWTKNWKADFIDCAKKTLQAELDVMEVSVDQFLLLTQNEQLAVKSFAQENGLTLTFCTGLGPEHDLASKEASVRKNGIEYVKKCLSLVHDMGANSYSGVNYAAWGGTMAPGESDRAPYISRSVQCMREIIKTAEEYGISYNLEVVNRFEQYIMNTCEEALAYVQEVGSPNLKVLLDTFHMNIEEDSLKTAVVNAGSKLGHLHFGENNRRQPGLGHLPWNDVFAGVKENGYTGRIVMEPFVISGGDIARDVKLYRELSGDDVLVEQAAAAGWFIRNGLQK